LQPSCILREIDICNQKISEPPLPGVAEEMSILV